MPKPFDGTRLGVIVAEVVREYVDRVTSRVEIRLNQLLIQLESTTALRFGSLEKSIAAIPAGPKGERGEKGIDGKDGAPGKDGRDGIAGDSGKDGRDGIDGKDGLNGKDGAPGERGPAGGDGFDGKDGAPGERGEKGDPGKDGRDGREGKDGRDGKDAADIIPLPSINAERSYTAGTWAAHRNGLWVADKTTHGMDGWRCAVAGVAESRDEWVNERTLRHTVELSDGKTFTSERKFPVPLYRGVWRAATTYERGDEATQDGSVWHCMAENTTQRPGTGSDWVLAVKRGNHGKDGAKGDKGDKGDPGRPAKADTW